MLKSGAVHPTPSELQNATANDRGTNGEEEKEESSMRNDLHQIPSNDDEDEKDVDMWDAELDLIGETHEDDELELYGKNEIKFECTYKQAGEDEEEEDFSDTVVEGVQILSTSYVTSSSITGIRFDVEISICVPPKVTSGSNSSGSGSGSGTFSNILEQDLQKRAQAEISQTRLEIRALLISSNAEEEKAAKAYSYLPSSPRHRGALDNFGDEAADDDMRLGLQALDMGISSQTPFISHDLGRGDRPSVPYFSQSLNYYLPSKSHDAPLLHLDILPALLVSVRGMSAAASKTGTTLVSMVCYHSNVHNENVTITNIALHPGQSRLLNMDNVDDEINTNATNMPPLPPIKNAKHNSSHKHNHHDHHGMIIPTGKAMPGGENAVIDMTKNVRWGYASGTAPSLPIVLKPQEAIATVLQINANEIMMERAFTSPIGIRAAVGDVQVLKTRMDSDSHASDIFRNEEGKSSSVVMVTADADWTTSPIAMKSTPTDAFRTSLSVRETVCTVGAQVVVNLKVMNLSSERRDLMLIMAKDDNADYTNNASGSDQSEKGTTSSSRSHSNDKERTSHLRGMSFAGAKTKSASTLGMMGASGHDHRSTSQQSAASVSTPRFMKHTINNAVVSEVDGYTFGCWGLDGYDDGTIRHTRDHDLLAVDAALLLGEVNGQYSIEAELRFVPLREGTLSVPNLKLYDKVEQKWYDCYHTLKIIAVANQ